MDRTPAVLTCDSAMSQIGRYEIVRQTGNHGLGSLYQAFDPIMHRPVMIRVADRNTNPSAVSIKPARPFCSTRNNWRIWTIRTSSSFWRARKMTGALLSDGALRGQAAQRHPPGRSVSSAVLKKAALALDHAHSKGLIHRNLTPDSLLVDDDGDLKITGFEIARPAQYLNSEAGQDLDLLLDSIHYMSPELVKGDTLDPRSDQYSLGVIAWQALTGALPFRADSPITLLAEHRL